MVKIHIILLLKIDLDMSKKELREATGLSTGTMTKLTKDEDVSMNALKIKILI